MTTTEFDESVFPFVFECSGCPYDSTAEITHSEAVEAVPPGIEATVRQAVERALVSRGWWEGRAGRVCPKCMEDRE
jgi:hypothetical protein